MISNKSVNKNTELLRSAFKEYYFRYSKNIQIPTRIHEREFGYMKFGSGMVRHLAFRNVGELLATLIKEVPSDVYCSNAYYRFPTHALQEKQWLGADLIFDVDVKDLHLPCDPTHSYFFCANCRNVSESESKLCPSCNNATILHQISIPCRKCNVALKREIKHLIDLLTDDLGVEEKSIESYFSGNNGFHLHILDKTFHSLDSQARSDIVNYIIGRGIITESIGVRKRPGDGFLIKFPRSGLSYGWRRRVANKLGIDQSSKSKLSSIVQQEGGYYGFKEKLVKMTKEMGVRIDPVVTTDIHRVFRMSGTLNSKSGFIKMKCTDLESFDPSIDACLLGDKEVPVETKASIKLKLKHQSFNIKKKIMTRLPLYAAVYLICKGLADAV